MGTAVRQLALALFTDYSQTDRSVAEAPVDLGFRRNNALVKIVDLSLAGRRLIDVAYFLATEDSTLHKEYRVDLGLFRWLLGTTSRNARHLQKIIREAQKAAIELSEVDLEDASNDWYGSVPLLGPAIVRNGELMFELSDRLQVAIKNPTAFHFLSLRYIFKSVHSKVLFDHLQQYLDQGVTPWFEVQNLRAWMVCETRTYDLFKHFRNKVLDVAIAEIGEVAKLTVEMQTQNVTGSKRIGQVRFKLTQQSSGGTDNQKTEFIVLRQLYETLRTEFALNQAEFNEIIANREKYTDIRIQEAIDYTKQNVKAGKVKLRAGGYFMKALREGYQFGTLDKEIHERLAATSSAKATSTQSAADREAKVDLAAAERDNELSVAGWDAFEQLADADQETIIKNFCQSPTAKPLARAVGVPLGQLQDHLTDSKVHKSFGIFVAGQVHKAAKAAKKAGNNESE